LHACWLSLAADLVDSILREAIGAEGDRRMLSLALDADGTHTSGVEPKSTSDQ
jgi:hypothetical protein